LSPAHGITRFAVTNYKPFEDEASVRVAPLTVVFGANGSGKSALVRIPVALAAALRPGPDDGPGLPWETRKLRFGSSLLSLCHAGIPTEFTLDAEIGGATLHAVIGKAPGSQPHLPGQWVQQWRAVLPDEHIDITWNRAGPGYPSPFTGFRGLVPISQAPTAGLIKLTEALATRVEHLGPRRDPGDGGPVAADLRPGFDVGSSGAQTGRVLAALRAHFPEALAEVCRAAEAVVGVELDIQELQVGATAGFNVRARRVGQQTWQPLGELGTGFAHVLPVIVQQVAARFIDGPPDLLVVEEPESHLHPGCQAKLADVFLDTARSGRCRSLVETHSETFILRLQRRVAEDPALAELLNFVFVDDEGGRPVVRSLDVQPDGDVSGWPDGWFDTALDEAQALNAARRARKMP
jgi:hypothetical protein